MTSETNHRTAEAPAPLGEVTKLYRHDCQYNSCPKRWSKFADHDSAEEALEKSTANDPIIHRYEFRGKKWVTKSFTVQNPAMRALLGDALAKYQDFDLELEDWTFKPPYKPIVHRWDALKGLCAGAVGTDAEPAANMLMDFLRPILANSVEALARTKATRKVTIGGVWQIFPPGELVMTTFFGLEAACRVTRYARTGHDVSKLSFLCITASGASPLRPSQVMIWGEHREISLESLPPSCLIITRYEHANP